jgi:hypothetical protein
MLWLSPMDNQGVRFLIDETKEKNAWEDRENEYQSNVEIREG